MTRRELLAKAAAALGAIGSFQILVSCGTSSGNGDLPFTSSSSGHTHTFTITAAELVALGALDRDDSTSSGHAHRVQISAAQMANIAAGGTESVTSGSSSSHTHSYTFKKA